MPPIQTRPVAAPAVAATGMPYRPKPCELYPASSIRASLSASRCSCQSRVAIGKGCFSEFIPDPSLDLRPIVSGFSSGSSKLPFYYCGTGAHGSWTGHEKTTFWGVSPKTGNLKVFLSFPFGTVFCSRKTGTRTSIPKQTQRPGRRRPSQGRCAKMFLTKRVTFHCNMQDVDSNIEIGMRNVFLTIVDDDQTGSNMVVAEEMRTQTTATTATAWGRTC